MEPNATLSPSADAQRLASLLEVFDHGVWEWHVPTGATHFSPEWLRGLGYEPSEVPSDVSFWSLYVHPDDYEPVRDLVQAHLEGHIAGISADARIRRKDGGWRTYSFRGKVVERSAGGEPLRVVGVSLDRTPEGGSQGADEQKQAAAQLIRAERLENIGRVAGAVAHDFNNLLTVINGYAEIALGSINPRDPLHDSLKEIKSAGDRAASLTQQLLAFSRRQVMQAVIVDINAILGDLEPMLHRLLGDQVELVLQRDEGIGAVKADPDQLRQVVMNLVMNARDAMPAGGKVVIATRNAELGPDFARMHADLHPGPYVQVSVTDTGSGMDEKTLGRLFEPFFTTKQKGKGTGLGLASAYGIVRQSGGHLAAESELGRGTTLKIHLPRVAAAEKKRLAPTHAAGRRSQGSETILLVEDQPEVRQLATRALKMYGYHVLAAGNGADALEVARQAQEPIALLLTDVLMPGMTGPTLAAAMMDLRPDISVLLMSGYSDRAPMPGRLPQGIECLQKPFTPEALARKVREVLDARAACGGGRVLVVDDEAEIRKLLRQFLEHAGYAVAEAANGLQAVAEVDAGGVSLVITDLVMPEKEGIETIREMRRRHRDVKIIAMSGAFGGRFLRTAEILGAHATLSKPVRAEQLVRTVGALLGAA